MDKPRAITAAAHKLARLIYALLTQGQECVDQGQDAYEARYHDRAVHSLQQRAAKLGLTFVVLPVAI